MERIVASYGLRVQLVGLRVEQGWKPADCSVHNAFEEPGIYAAATLYHRKPLIPGY
ncbi:hypothetical protein MesoLjLc_24610 [Mesorhizobium sp. L-8-10]|uniref:hypothetical protein n=1 Tax=unclassified Mesorhizobium TaxID=325217 RepID=UPI00192854DC|nr:MULTISPECIES: hypothetical protein [unclassified Mesorhizobium]BCH22727.1 hypothetical protein MesoLjLb_25120 [Mesorhizobium sp. L-8-3]BCH30531.1 hypothetical protein MesoLjLc_24610 [Mesorhizobium sp. L-8-10]